MAHNEVRGTQLPVGRLDGQLPLRLREARADVLVVRAEFRRAAPEAHGVFEPAVQVVNVAEIDERIQMVGLINELIGENGLIWNMRVLMLGLGGPERAAREAERNPMYAAYGYSEDARAAAPAKVAEILEIKGKGHSCGIHTRDLDHARELAEDLDVVRVLVNQAHTFGNGGSFNNGLNFTLSMGCGTWAGNSISDNLNYRHFINITHLVTTVGEDKPSEEELFGDYWQKYGK